MGATTPLTREQRNLRALQQRAKRLDAVNDHLWDQGVRAPMFCGAVGQDKKGRVIRRSTRRVSGHAYNTAIAGALSLVVAKQAAQCHDLGLPFDVDANGDEVEPSSKVGAMLIPMSKGAKLLVEQALASAVHQIVLKARAIRDAGKRQRLNKHDIREALEAPTCFGASDATLVVPRAKRATAAAAAPHTAAQATEDDEGEASARKDDSSTTAA